MLNGGGWLRSSPPTYIQALTYLSPPIHTFTHPLTHSMHCPKAGHTDAIDSGKKVWLLLPYFPFISFSLGPTLHMCACYVVHEKKSPHVQSICFFPFSDRSVRDISLSLLWVNADVLPSFFLPCCPVFFCLFLDMLAISVCRWIHDRHRETRACIQPWSKHRHHITSLSLSR